MKPSITLCLACIAIQPVLAQTNSAHIVSVDSARIGGLYGFQILVKDEALLREKFGGHDLELRFEPTWTMKHFPFVEGNPYGVCDRLITVYDKTTNTTLAQYEMLRDTPPCDPLDDIALSEHAAIFLQDENDPMAVDDSREKKQVAGSFTTDRACYGDRRFIEGAFGLAFNYGFEQWGGVIRSGAVTLIQGEANTFLTFSNTGVHRVDSTQVHGQWRGANNGPAAYEMEFMPGGVETIAVRYGTLSVKVDTFNVQYLNVRVRNTISYERPEPGGGTTTVSYSGEMPHFTVTNLAANWTAWPDPMDVPIGSFNLSAFAWINSAEGDAIVTDRPKQAGGPGNIVNSENKGIPVGTQGRYYLSTVNERGVHLDFVHVLEASGAEMVLDYANKRSRRSVQQWRKAKVQPTVDFKAGDKTGFSTLGGPLGLPLPGASVAVHIDAATGVAETNTPTPAVSPNPFSDHTTIRYTLGHPAHVTLTVMDELGRTVATVVDGYQQAGTYSPVVEAAGLKNGCYFYRLITGESTTVGKIVVFR